MIHITSKKNKFFVAIAIELVAPTVTLIESCMVWLAGKYMVRDTYLHGNTTTALVLSAILEVDTRELNGIALEFSKLYEVYLTLQIHLDQKYSFV